MSYALKNDKICIEICLKMFRTMHVKCTKIEVPNT